MSDNRLKASHMLAVLGLTAAAVIIAIATAVAL